MNFLQTYYNINTEGLNFSGGYLNSIVNWLSIAYSCLKLRKSNPNAPLIFYGDTDTIHILRDLFKLPYDEFHVLNRQVLENNKYYCFPKIVTYSLQEEPFIHIDTDIFVNKQFPLNWNDSNLIAQHQEQDSSFYMLVYKYLKKCKVELLDIQKVCIGDKYINSYNLGIVGGQDIGFFKEYIQYIDKFMKINKKSMLSSDKEFLFNVVFEQWMFYALAQKRKEPVTTIYNEVVKDFMMPNGSVPERIVREYPINYLHIMEHKKHVRCNSYIVRNMLLEFPDVYGHILSICSKKGVKVPQLSVPDKIMQEQLGQQMKLNKINQHLSVLSDFKLKLSPYIHFLELSDKQKKILRTAKIGDYTINKYLNIKTFDAFMGMYHNYLYSDKLLSILLKFENPKSINDIIVSTPMINKEALVHYIKQAIYDNILICI